MKHSLARLAIVVLGTTCLTGTAFGQGDYYIRSQHSNGAFTGFHEILTRPKAGYHQARYCDRTFWVSSTTVIWTEEQNAAGRTLILEENVGSGRRIVCSDNSSFATLDDLGLSEREVARIRAANEPLDMKSSRLRTIRDAFKSFK
ncbi:hypothetical protein [Roseibium sp. MMSF_3544]|uniref:hypothetical protein n=1 Tax=unclassified Roseibium TaxID=2629323 RepID=UPI00273D6E72|nr:hypothetical protein [Roseibium sp. MMSF_3544]